MRVEVISIGGELLIGHTVNTNFALIGATLAEHGYGVDREVCIPDHPQTVAKAVHEALAQAHLVITIGGLGPTRDDLTRDVVAAALDRPLHFSPSVHDHIQAYLAKRLVNLPDHALKTQSMVPQGATPLLNTNGTAPGLWCPVDADHAVVLLPGPPRELKPILVEQVMPRILAAWPPQWHRRTVRVCGIPESRLAERVETVLDGEADIDIAYCARPGVVDVRLTGPKPRQASVDRCARHLEAELGEAVLAEGDDLVEAIARCLTRAGMSLAVAESCTGGGLGAAITERSGAAEFFLGGVIAYDNAVKRRELGVPDEILETCGAVSEATARAMVQGVCARFHADAGIAVTGIAGPDGGTEEKPVGLVFIATRVGDDVRVERRIYPGDRETVRQRTVNSALNQLREQIK